jgi:transposase
MFRKSPRDFIMFVRVKLKADGIKRSIQIVANTRVKGTVTQRILRHVGTAYDDASETMLKEVAEKQIAQLVAEAASEHPQISCVSFEGLPVARKGRKRALRLAEVLSPAEVRLEDVREESRVTEGIHDVIGPVFDSIYGRLLKSTSSMTLLKDIVLARIADPDSKRASVQLLEQQFGHTHDLDAVYRLMDDVFKHIPRIKQQTFDKTRSLFPDGVDVILFDVTTLYFESISTDDVRCFGYSKDHRFNTTQVVLALATNSQGLPVGYELFAGNKAEVTTLVAAIDAWKALFKIESACFIGDRAMFTQANVALLQEKGYHYVIAAKLKGLPRELQTTILDATHYRTCSLNNELAWIGEFATHNSRLIVSYKSQRARKDQREREAVLNKIKNTLGKKGHAKKIVTNSGVKQYVSIDDNAFAQIDTDKIDKAAQWDGLHGVITNILDASPESILARYAQLWVIEESFRINKHTLKMRPIYHRKNTRIQSHIALCYMAFSLMRYVQHHLKVTESLTMSVRHIIDALLQVQASILKHKHTNDRYRLPSAMNHNARKIYNAFGLHRSLDVEPYLKN